MIPIWAQDSIGDGESSVATPDIDDQRGLAAKEDIPINRFGVRYPLKSRLSPLLFGNNEPWNGNPKFVFGLARFKNGRRSPFSMRPEMIPARTFWTHVFRSQRRYI